MRSAVKIRCQRRFVLKIEVTLDRSLANAAAPLHSGQRKKQSCNAFLLCKLTYTKPSKKTIKQWQVFFIITKILVFVRDGLGGA